MMLGQDKLLAYINTLTLDNCPRNILCIGDAGSGKHTLINYLADHLAIPVEDITHKISGEFILDAYERVVPIIYLIDANQFSITNQNMVLKFLEEPPTLAYIALLINNEASLLETINNRCAKWFLEKYDDNILTKFLPDNLDIRYIKIFRTPGQLLSANNLALDEMFMLAESIFTKIEKANFPNILTIADKLAFKSNDEGFNILIFNKILLETIVNLNLQTTDLRYIKAYNLTAKYVVDATLPRLDLKYLFYNFLVNLRYIMRNEK